MGLLVGAACCYFQCVVTVFAVFTCYSCCASAVVQDRQLPKYFSLTDGAEFLSLFSHLNHSLC